MTVDLAWSEQELATLKERAGCDLSRDELLSLSCAVVGVSRERQIELFGLSLSEVEALRQRLLERLGVANADEAVELVRLGPEGHEGRRREARVRPGRRSRPSELAERSGT